MYICIYIYIYIYMNTAAAQCITIDQSRSAEWGHRPGSAGRVAVNRIRRRDTFELQSATRAASTSHNRSWHIRPTASKKRDV